MTYWALVVRAANDDPERVVAVDDHGRSLTTAGLRDTAERVAAGLHERGVKPGDVVSWQLPTTLEAAVLIEMLRRTGP